MSSYQEHWNKGVRAWGWTSPRDDKQVVPESEQVKALQHTLTCNHNSCRQTREGVVATLKRSFAEAQETRGVFIQEGSRLRPARVSDLPLDE